jgi:hypothetical protein
MLKAQKIQLCNLQTIQPKELKNIKRLTLFKKLQNKGLFWSYAQDIQYNEKLLIEHTLKYADFDDIVSIFKLFDKNAIKQVWEKTMKNDKRFIKINLMLARIFFNMKVESNYFKETRSERLEKLKLLTS